MSDLVRDDVINQPTDVPVLGTPTGVYTAPGEEWDGDPVRSALSDGEEEGGLVPDEGVDAEVLNDLIGRLGQGLATILDSAAINWGEPFLATDDEPFFHGMGNGLWAGPIVAPGHWYGGIEGDVLLAVNSSGLWCSQDGRYWGGSGNALGFSEAPDAMTVGHYEFSGSDYVTIVVFSEEGDGEFRASDNFGSSFYDAGFLPAIADEDGADHAFAFFEPVGRYIFSNGTQMYYFDAADDLSTNAEWGAISLAGLGFSGPTNPNCIATSPTEIAIGYGGGPRILRSTDANTWVQAGTIAGLTAPPEKLYWSDSHKLWIAICLSGGTYSLWTAPAGMAAWTERAAPTWINGSAITPLRDVMTLGRTIILAAGTRLYASRTFGGVDGTEWVRVGPKPAAGGTEAWRWVLPFNGGIWAAQTAYQSPGTGLTFEATTSHILPSELRRIKAW